MSRIDDLRDEFASTMSRLAEIKDEIERIEGNEDYDENLSLVGKIFVKRLNNLDIYYNVIGIAGNGNLIAIELFCAESPDLSIRTVYFKNREDVCRSITGLEDVEDVELETVSSGEFYRKYKQAMNMLISFRFRE